MTIRRIRHIGIIAVVDHLALRVLSRAVPRWPRLQQEICRSQCHMPPVQRKQLELSLITYGSTRGSHKWTGHVTVLDESAGPWRKHFPGLQPAPSRKSFTRARQWSTQSITCSCSTTRRGVARTLVLEFALCARHRGGCVGRPQPQGLLDNACAVESLAPRDLQEQPRGGAAVSRRAARGKGQGAGGEGREEGRPGDQAALQRARHWRPHRRRQRVDGRWPAAQCRAHGLCASIPAARAAQRI